MPLLWTVWCVAPLSLAYGLALVILLLPIVCPCIPNEEGSGLDCAEGRGGGVWWNAAINVK